MASAGPRKPSKSKKASVEENKAGSRSAWETASDDDGMVETLLRGSDEERETVLAVLKKLAPERKAVLRENLKAAIGQARKRGRWEESMARHQRATQIADK